MMIDIEFVKQLLREYGDLKESDDIIQHRTPRHGPCCTCQTCGYYHDECVCTHNEIIIKLKTYMLRFKKDD
jgi:hypothetical protein